MTHQKRKGTEMTRWKVTATDPKVKRIPETQEATTKMEASAAYYVETWIKQYRKITVEVIEE